MGNLVHITLQAHQIKVKNLVHNIHLAHKGTTEDSLLKVEDSEAVTTIKVTREEATVKDTKVEVTVKDSAAATETTMGDLKAKITSMGAIRTSLTTTIQMIINAIIKQNAVKNKCIMLT